MATPANAETGRGGIGMAGDGGEIAVGGRLFGSLTQSLTQSFDRVTWATSRAKPTFFLNQRMPTDLFPGLRGNITRMDGSSSVAAEQRPSHAVKPGIIK